MAFFEITSTQLRPVPETTFASSNIKERADLQRLLRAQIEVVSPDTLVVAEEFGEWDGSNRRIDLLGVDRDANLVVIELKRTEDGGHMDLQAIRYAAMVSSMTFERLVEVYSDFLQKLEKPVDARSALLKHLYWEESEPDNFARSIRIVLVSAEFSTEVTTSVLWLNDQGLDIRCVRMKPYADDGRVWVDVQQIIPLPEASEYIVGIKKKQASEKLARESTKDNTKYDLTVGGNSYTQLPKRTAIFYIVKFLCDSGVTPTEISAVNNWTDKRFRSSNGTVTTRQEFIARQEQDLEAGKEFEAFRFFCNDDELIHSGGRTWALTNQFGQHTYKFITKLIEEYPGKGITCTPSI